MQGKMDWGPGYIIPEDAKSKCTVGAWYPKEALSENKSMRIHNWRYNGGIKGLIKGYIRAIKWCRDRDLPLSEALIASFEFAPDWEKLDTFVEVNQSNRPCIVSEIYPNENKGRMVLSAFHLVRNVWWGGHIQEQEDTDDNYIADDLFQLVDYIPFNQTPEDEKTHTWWMVRRQIAYAAKVADNDLPPVYGPSQVCDFEEDKEESDFIVNCDSQIDKGNISIELYYRFSSDNSSWGDWTYFETDDDKTDGWSWQFNSPEGLGYYQFYSSRILENGDETTIEDQPIGPDAFVYVK
jgi:hypothetical protein